MQWHWRRSITTVCMERVNTLLRNVELPQPWSMNSFIDRLEAYRGRQIDLYPFTWTPDLGSTGAWERYDDHDVIAYAANTTAAHQDYNILHEVGHMISSHGRQCVLASAEALTLAPTLGATAFGHLMTTVSFTRAEKEADMIATLLLARIARGDTGGLDYRMEALR
jgi:hypothetical protein